MGIKQKLGLGVASAALGLALVGGGTYAYFSDTAETTSTFAAGTLDLSANPTTIIDVDNLKPGDWMTKSFKLKNDGSLDIKEVLLNTSYTLSDSANDLGEHIQVNFLSNGTKDPTSWISPNNSNSVIYHTTLKDLKDMTPDAVRDRVFIPFFGGPDHGLEAGEENTLLVQFKFVDNGGDQNAFQGDSLSLKWDFVAKQTAGENRSR